jgi:hypothetical protein
LRVERYSMIGHSFLPAALHAVVPFDRLLERKRAKALLLILSPPFILSFVEEQITFVNPKTAGRQIAATTNDR